MAGLAKHDKEASNRYFRVTAALEPFSSFLVTNLGTSYNLAIAGSGSGLAQLLLNPLALHVARRVDLKQNRNTPLFSAKNYPTCP